MVMTYSFIIKAQRSKGFMQQIKDSIASKTDTELCTDIHRLRFSRENKMVTVLPLSDNSDFHEKIIPTEIAYCSLLKMLDGSWDDINPDDIRSI